MNRTFVTTVVLQLALAAGTCAFAGADAMPGDPASAPEGAQCPLGDPSDPVWKESVHRPHGLHPKVVFQINQAADAPVILRFVANYLSAEPAAEVVVVGYGGGADFMLKGALDAKGKPYAEHLQALASRGVMFKLCNNTLKARNLTADAVAPQVTVIPGAVNEIIRLQTREGFAYFRP